MGRRSDGYHELASLFQAIDLCDVVHFELASQDLLTCTDPEIPTDASNLILKATALFRQKTKCSFGVKVHLEKRIPHQAGLGGGSSNAATTLWALNQLCGYPATVDELRRWAGEIGSDIAFFLSEGTAFCTGRGEIMRTLPALPSPSLWIVKPKEGLSTQQVYRALDLSSIAKKDPETLLQRFLSGEPDYLNDLEAAAFKVMPKLADIKTKLLAKGFSTVLLSGSGSSFFCIGRTVSSQVEETSFYQTQFINRRSQEWYAPPLIA